MPGPVVIPLHWSQVPGRTQEWAQKLRRELKIDKRTWRREYEIDFGVEPGKPVFKPPFRMDWHVPKTEMVANPALGLVRGWDYGFHHPACIFIQVATNGQILYLAEMLGTDILLSDFVAEVLIESRHLMGSPRYPVADFDDPAGQQVKDTGMSSRQVLNAYKLYPRNSGKKVPVVESLNLIKQNLAIRSDGRPGTLVNRSCLYLLRAFDGAYCAAEKDPDSAKKPRFRGGITEHIVDAARYANAGMSSLGRRPCELKPLVFS